MSVRWVRVGEVAQRRSEPIAVDPDEKYRMIGLLNRGRGIFERGIVSGFSTKYPHLYALRSGDLVFSRLFGWEGAVAISDRDGWVSSEFPVYDIAPMIDSGYLRHAVSWNGFVEQLASGTTGMGQRRQRVPSSVFENSAMPLPDLPEQHRVAARLDAVSQAAGHRSKPDALVRASNSVWNQLSNSPTVQIGNIVVRDQDFVALDSLASHSPVGVRSFGRGLIRYPKTPFAELSKMRYAMLPPDRLVVSNIKAWEGAVALSGSDASGAVVSNRFLVYRPSDRVELRYLHYFLVSEAGVALLSAASPGSADRNRTLRARSFENISVPLPDLDEQRYVIERLDAIDRVQDAMRRRDALAAALLPAARNEEFSRLVAQAG